MKTLVITSINPNKKLVYQIICFNKWKELGYVVKTFNCEEERTFLLKHGIDAADVIELAEGETATGLFGKAIPRILPVLNRAITYNTESIILVNSDIYPGHRKPISTYLATFAETIALTRNECIEIADIRYTDSYHYRGGLDIFFFTSSGLRKVFQSMTRQSVAERMTFGIPGWDLFLGHMIVFEHNGLIMDGEVFFHQSHSTTYNQINEFGYYAKQMYKSGVYHNSGLTEIAAEFAAKIHNLCMKNSQYSRLLKMISYSRPVLPNRCEHDFQSVFQIEDDFYRILEEFEIDVTYYDNQIRYFIRNQLDGINWSVAELYRNRIFGHMPAINGYLLLLLLQLKIKEHANLLNLTDEYPANSLHGTALRQIRNKTTGKERLDCILRLFSSELLDHSIFNSNLFKFISLSADTPNSLNLCFAIFTLCKKGLTKNV